MADKSFRWTLRVSRVAASLGRAILGHLPFVGRLTFRAGVPWKKAAAETTVSVVLTSLSIWIGVIALRFTALESTSISAANQVIENGELYLLSSAAVSPIFYIAIVRYRSDEPNRWITVFPHGILYILSSLIIISIAIVFIALRSVLDHPNSHTSLSITPFINLSWAPYAFSLFLFFTASVHKYILEETGPSVFREDEKEFGSEFMRSRDA